MESELLQQLRSAALLCAAPGCSMFLGSALAFKLLTGESKRLLSVTQYFSAGLLIAAIGFELVPKLILSEKEGHGGLVGDFAIAVGFFGGVALMLAIEHIMEDDDANDDDPSVASDISYMTPKERWRKARVKLIAVRKLSLAGKKVGSNKSACKISLLLEAAKKAQSQGVTEPLPCASAIPIYVDSLVDGLLIGIVLTASFHAGAIMALATTIEMGFLGVTFGAMLKPCGSKRWPAAALAPVILVAGGIIGTVFAGALEANPAIFKGIVAFGISALLFLVTHELLNEAKENMGDEEDWHLSVWLFNGFFFIIMSERVFPDEA